MLKPGILRLNKTLAWVTVLGLGAAAGWLAVSVVVDYKVRQITHPARVADQLLDRLTGDAAFQPVSLPTSDGIRLAGWYQPSRNGATVILQHGYAANADTMLPAAQMLHQHGYGVLLFDFRGHGRSGGDTVTLGLNEVKDTQAALAFLRNQPGGLNEKIGLLGNSMGGAVAILAATDEPSIQAICVEGVFAELRDEVAVGIRVQTPLPAEPFSSLFVFFAEKQTSYKISDVAPIRKIGAISPRAVMILQGGADARVNPDTGQRLFDAAGEPKEYWYAPGVGHVAFAATIPADYEQRIVAFFSRYLGR